jgi:fatty-acyl-CoA synthase
VGIEISAKTRWGAGEEVSEDELQEHLEKDFARFWLPDACEFVESIPMIATGKFQNLKLREQLADGS